MIGPFLIGLFIFLLLNFKSSLYILDTVLHQMCFLQIFSSSLVCLLSPLTLSFREKKFLILMKFILSIISFTDCAFGVIAKKSSPYPRTSRFSRMLPSMSFIFKYYISDNFQILVSCQDLPLKSGTVEPIVTSPSPRLIHAYPRLSPKWPSCVLYLS